MQTENSRKHSWGLKSAARLVGARALVAGACLLASGCATESWFAERAETRLQRERAGTEAPVATASGPGKDESRSTQFFQNPKVPARELSAARKAPPAPTSASFEDREASVSLNAMPLPQFIDAVFGTILKRNISIDPQVMQRKDMVSLRTGKPQSAASLFSAAKGVLRSYGVAVQEFEGLVRFVPDNGDTGLLPEIRRGRALPDVPETVRPVFYFVELEYTNVSYASNWIKTAFPNKLTVQDDPARNGVLLTGQVQYINAATQMLQVLDQPLMRSRVSARIVPVFWSADELSRRLTEILTAEGYYAGSTPTAPSPVMLMPVGSINAVLVFATNQKLLDHVLFWARDLDQPTRAAGTGNYFTYGVRNADATDIAATLQQVMGGGVASTAGASVTGNTGTTAARSSGGAPRIVVNKATNSLIIQTTPSEYQQWYSLLQELDRPARSALVSVTVAEVNLSENEQFGFNWLVKQFEVNGTPVNMSANLGVADVSSTGGFSLKIGSLPTLALSALASKTKVHILSNPSILTRSGEDATISVGNEVPVITSQQSNANTNTNNGGVLQTIQYRNTGIILRVRPVVHSGGRIDLDVSQEVSSAVQTTNGVNASPTISTRKLDTKLTVADGNTVVIGGLMQDSRNDSGGGVPYLKDAPILGGLFRNHNNKGEKTELVVLITTYAIEDEFDAQAISEAFRTRFPWSDPLYGPVAKRPVAGENALKQADSIGAARGTKDNPADAADASRPLPYVPQPPTAPRAPEAAPPAVDPDADRPVDLSPLRALPLSNGKTGMEQKPGSASMPATPDAAPAAKGIIPLPPGSPPGRVVTDEKLKRELMEAIRKGQ